VVHVSNKFWQYSSSNTDKLKATEHAALTFTQGSHSLLSGQFNQTAARYAAANKNIMMGILLAEKALLKSPYVKR
jgi:hypothetical protein